MYGTKKFEYTEEAVEKFFKRLTGCNGNLKLACQSLGISTSLPQNWKRDHPEFAERLKEYSLTKGRSDRWYYT